MPFPLRLHRRPTLPRSIRPVAPPHWTPRLRNIARHVAERQSNKEIAAAEGLTEGTVKQYLFAIYQVLNIIKGDSRVTLARWVWDHPGDFADVPV